MPSINELRRALSAPNKVKLMSNNVRPHTIKPPSVPGVPSPGTRSPGINTGVLRQSLSAPSSPGALAQRVKMAASLTPLAKKMLVGSGIGGASGALMGAKADFRDPKNPSKKMSPQDRRKATVALGLAGAGLGGMVGKDIHGIQVANKRIKKLDEITKSLKDEKNLHPEILRQRIRQVGAIIDEKIENLNKPFGGDLIKPKVPKNPGNLRQMTIDDREDVIRGVLKGKFQNAAKGLDGKYTFKQAALRAGIMFKLAASVSKAAGEGRGWDEGKDLPPGLDRDIRMTFDNARGGPRYTPKKDNQFIRMIDRRESGG